jgi:hypothetical protein
MTGQPIATQYPAAPARPPRIAPLISLGQRQSLEVTRRTDILRGEHVKLETIRGGQPAKWRLHLTMQAARELGATLLELAGEEAPR